MNAEALEAHNRRAEQVASRLRDIRQVASEDVSVVAVTKGRSPEWVLAALECGVLDFGENYADELLQKSRDVRKMLEALALPAPRWHYLGKLQSNKIPRLTDEVFCWQTLDRPRAADLLSRHAPNARVLIQVKTAQDPARPGVAPSDLSALLEHAGDAGVNAEGLMCVARQDAAEEDFAMVSELADRFSLRVRSMGMSEDYQAAIRCGATMLRLGRVLFSSDL